MDILTIILNDTLVAESDEDKPGIILDYDEEGNVVSMEILDASRRIAQPTQMVYELANQPV
jgi:YD repeat-containing protein